MVDPDDRTRRVRALPVPTPIEVARALRDARTDAARRRHRRTMMLGEVLVHIAVALALFAWWLERDSPFTLVLVVVELAAAYMADGRLTERL